MATKKEIQKRFVEYFPHLAGVKLRRGRVSLGPSVARVMGIEALCTVAYLVGTRLTDQATVPITGEVCEWEDIRWLLSSNGCLVTDSVVIIERVIYDHVKSEQSSMFYLRDV